MHGAVLGSSSSRSIWTRVRVRNTNRVRVGVSVRVRVRVRARVSDKPTCLVPVYRGSPRMSSPAELPG